MPILPPEPECFPASLFDDATLLEYPGRLWWVLHTRSRQEKSLARQLHRQRTPYYLPLIAQRRRVRRGIQTSYVPLFAGYVFLLANAEERLAALSTSRVVRSLEVPGQEELWRDLASIQRLITSGAPLRREDRLVPGTLVEIQSGPLAGLRGKILRSSSGRRFVVQVDFIQRGTSVLLEDCNLTAVDVTVIGAT